MSEHRTCPFCGRDTSGLLGYITPRRLPAETSWRAFVEPLTSGTRDWRDVRSCQRAECIHAARVLDLKQIEAAIERADHAQ